jgi:putative ABC transport system substrate-binding protein
MAILSGFITNNPMSAWWASMHRKPATLPATLRLSLGPADLPIERPTRYELIVNLKASKTIGLTIPDSFVLLADEVIE